MNKTKSKMIDPYYSVFNQHINKAGVRALKVLKDNFPSAYQEIMEFKKKGIMCIFNQDPTGSTAMYVALVTAFVKSY